jgi:Protein of unknown function (DUF1573)
MRRNFVFIGMAVTAITVAVLAGTVVGNALRTNASTAKATVPLVFVVEDLTFGPVPESEQIEHELRVTNVSSDEVRIDRFTTSCTCLGVEPKNGIVLQPSETKAIRIKLKGVVPDEQRSSSDGKVSTTVEVSAVIRAPGNGKWMPVTATLRFSIQRAIRFEPAYTGLGIVSHREPVIVNAIVTLFPPVVDVRVLPNPEWQVRITKMDENRRAIRAQPTQIGVPRVLNDTLYVVPYSSVGVELPHGKFAISGEIKADVVSLPAQIPLGRVECGVTVEESFRLTSLTNRSFDVVKVEPGTPDVVVTADPMDPKVFSARVETKEKGEQERLVVIRVRQNDGNELTVRIPIRYLGQ